MLGLLDRQEHIQNLLNVISAKFTRISQLHITQPNKIDFSNADDKIRVCCFLDAKKPPLYPNSCSLAFDNNSSDISSHKGMLNSSSFTESSFSNFGSLSTPSSSFSSHKNSKSSGMLTPEEDESLFPSRTVNLKTDDQNTNANSFSTTDFFQQKRDLDHLLTLTTAHTLIVGILTFFSYNNKSLIEEDKQSEVIDVIAYMAMLKRLEANITIQLANFNQLYCHPAPVVAYY